MRVTFVTSSISRKAGGLFTSVRRLAQNLSETIEIKVATVEDEFTDMDCGIWKPLAPAVFPVVGPESFGYSPPLLKALREGESDLLHCQGLWMYPSWASLHSGKQYIITPRGMLDPWAIKNSHWKKRLAGWAFENKHLHRAACIHALCKSEAESIRAYGLKNPICVIPNGIDIPENTDGKADNGIAPWSEFVASGEKVLLFLSRIHPKKGLINLLKAWKETRDTRSSGSWVLAIAGWDQGGHEEELKRLCDELAIIWRDAREQRTFNAQDSNLNFSNASVLFLGPQFGDDKAECYTNCDAFILPSFSEGLPMVVLEAWAHGKPVLMTPECNLPEGFSMESAIKIQANVESISKGLQELFEITGKERDMIGQQGLALVSGQFTWPKIAMEMNAVYQWVLGGGTKPASVID